jgi:hypothetical protein
VLHDKTAPLLIAGVEYMIPLVPFGIGLQVPVGRGADGQL